MLMKLLFHHLLHHLLLHRLLHHQTLLILHVNIAAQIAHAAVSKEVLAYVTGILFR
jgi:hypothetical protein